MFVHFCWFLQRIRKFQTTQSLPSRILPQSLRLGALICMHIHTVPFDLKVDFACILTRFPWVRGFSSHASSTALCGLVFQIPCIFKVFPVAWELSLHAFYRASYGTIQKIVLIVDVELQFVCTLRTFSASGQLTRGTRRFPSSWEYSCVAVCPGVPCTLCTAAAFVLHPPLSVVCLRRRGSCYTKVCNVTLIPDRW